MKNPTMILAIAFAFVQSGNAATVLFSETFTGATVNGTNTNVVGSTKTWDLSVFNGVTGQTAVPATNDFATVEMGNYTSPTSTWYATQFKTTALSGLETYNSNLGDVTVSFDMMVDSTFVPSSKSFNLQLRQFGQTTGNGTTHTKNFTATLGGGWINYQFTLDQSKQSGFTAFNANDVQLLFEFGTNWNGATDLTYSIDNIQVSAVPEPGSFMMLAGVLPIACFLRRRKA